MSEPERGRLGGDLALPLGVLVSGEGTGLQNLIDRIADGRLRAARIAVVISSRSTAPAVERARRAGIPVEIIRVRDYPEIEAFSAAIVDALERHGVQLAVQAGWLCFWRPPARWSGRVINIHPALLPDFGGKGYYGRHVHEAVLAAGRSESGATVHFVDEQYDHGPIIVQGCCPVRPDDTPETLAARVAALEHELLPEAIERVRGRLASAASLSPERSHLPHDL